MRQRRLLRRFVALAAVALVGLLLVVGAGADVRETSAGPPTPGATSPRTAPEPPPDTSAVFLVWTSGGLPEGFADAVADIAGVAATTVVRGDRVDLLGSRDVDGNAIDVLADGWAVPLDALAIDPATYASFQPETVAAVLATLGPGEVVLGSTSATLRRVAVGSVLDVAGVELTVVGVVDDASVGAAEIVVTHETGLQIGVERERFVLVRTDDDDGRLERAVTDLLGAETAVGLVRRGDVDHLRHGSGVLAQSKVKALFGEFSYRITGGRDFTPDPAWVRENIVTERVPILGRITCHRDFMPLVRGALTELEEAGLAHLIRFREYAGCWHPRFTGARRSVSRHSWGMAIDFNAAANPYGAEPDQDARLVEIMERWGMGWGGRWLVPDAMHFEYVGDQGGEPADTLNGH